jgi:hypothetical protein
MNSKPFVSNQDSFDLSWREQRRLITRTFFSWRMFGIYFGISILLMCTLGIAFQIVFVFSFLRGFVTLATISQPFYATLRRITRDESLPLTLAKPPLSAYLLSVIPLLLSILFLFLGIYAFRISGFCAQSFGCIFWLLIQSL